MPIVRGKDSKGSYYSIDKVGTKWYYFSGHKASRDKAYDNALAQLRAIKANKR